MIARGEVRGLRGLQERKMEKAGVRRNVCSGCVEQIDWFCESSSQPWFECVRVKKAADDYQLFTLTVKTEIPCA